ncbi:MAG: response regulator [Flavobacteriaceae bacterium]|nr:response regulator [Flavobacteriaceae bacterium]
MPLTYLKKSAYFKYKNQDSTTYYAIKASRFNQQHTTEKSLSIQCSIYLSIAYFLEDDLQLASVYIEEAHQKALLKKDLFYLQQTTTIKGNIRLAQGNSFKAIIDYKNALMYAKSLNKPILNSITNQNLSLCYASQQKTNLAEQFVIQALKDYDSIAKKEDSQRTLYTNIVLNNIQYSEKLKEGLHLIKQLKDTALFYKNNDHLSLINLHKGRLLSRFKQYDAAIKTYEKSLVYSRRNNYKNKELSNILEIANTYLLAKNHKTALYFLNQFLRKRDQSNPIHSTLNVNLLASTIFSKSNNLVMAQHYALKYGKEKDSILNHNVNNIFAAYGKRFESEQKEKEITLNKLKISQEINKRNLILFGSLIALILGYRIFRKTYNKEKRKKNEAEVALKKEVEFTDARTKFLGNISHEIRTPITLIIGYLNLMKDSENSLTNKKYIARALFNCEKVISDANDVLTLIKFEKHKTQLNILNLPLHDFIKKTFFSFENTASYQQITLEFDTEINPTLNIDFDFDKLEKILNNIISNALKYTHSNTSILLKCYISKKRLVLSIKDEGIGISSSEKEKVFERYYQASSKKSTGGLGIGLSLVKELVHFLNGDIQLKSTLNKGSTFTVSLPINTKSNKLEHLPLLKTVIADKMKFQNHEFKESSKPKILVVDDNIEMLKYLQELFTTHFNALFVSSGKEALLLIRKYSFDLITSDVMMPNMDGFDFKILLNNIPGHERIPFIMISANTFSDAKIKGFNLGINDYITKPFESIELITRIKNLLKNSLLLKRSPLDSLSYDIPITSPTHEEQLITKTTSIVLKNIEDETFKIDQLAKEIGYSQRQLSRILIKQTGLSPVKFILEIKLKKAYLLIKSRKFSTISEVRFKVGINSGSYFTKKFKERFGITPTNLN